MLFLDVVVGDAGGLLQSGLTWMDSSVDLVDLESVDRHKTINQISRLSFIFEGLVAIVTVVIVVDDASGLLQSGLTWMDSCQAPPFCRQPPPSHLSSL